MRAVFLASDFLRYCEAHPDQRFWQALANWSGQRFIWAGERYESATDTWDWKGRGPRDDS